MEWRKPEFEEISMNAEIGSYQEDEGGRYPLAAGMPRLDAMPEPESPAERDQASA